MLTPERVDALFAPLARRRRLLLAVSGGPDSNALLYLAATWAARNGGPEIYAATVDHGLRPESGAEALAVGALAARLGVPHAILRWQGKKPASRLQERAREARYALLATHARELGAEAIVTAHHLGDQAETVLMRLLRGSGVAGLAGMAAEAEREGVAISRPLLELEKDELVAVCDAAGLAYVSDPSNENDRFTRARLRKLLADEGLDARALVRLARRAAQAETALRQIADLAEAELRLAATGSCLADALFARPLEISQRVLCGAVARFGGRDARRVPLEKLEALFERLGRAHAHGEAFSANVAGARIRLSRGNIVVGPEPARRHTISEFT